MPINATPTNGSATFDTVANVNDVYGIIEKVGKQTFGEMRASNRLGRFDKGFLEYGTTVEETLVAAAESRAYVPNASSATTPINPTTVTRYFNDWVDRDYKVSVKNRDVRAVLNGGMTVGDLVAATLASIDNGERRDDYNDMLAVIKKFGDSIEDGGYARESQRIPAEDVTDPTALLERIRFIASDMSFDNDIYAGVDGVQTETDTAKLVILMPHGLLNKLDVRVFAQMFNLAKADIVPEIVPINTTDGRVIVCDEDAFGSFTRDREFTMVQNGNARSRDYTLGVSKMFYYNPLYKAAVIDASAID